MLEIKVLLSGFRGFSCFWSGGGWLKWIDLFLSLIGVLCSVLVVSGPLHPVIIDHALSYDSTGDLEMERFMVWLSM